MKRVWILVGVLGLLAAVGLAQTQMEMNERAAQKAKQADDVLNKTYGRLMGMLDEPAKDKLRASQRAWVKFRDAECEFAADEYRGGRAVDAHRLPGYEHE